MSEQQPTVGDLLTYLESQPLNPWWEMGGKSFAMFLVSNGIRREDRSALLGRKEYRDWELAFERFMQSPEQGRQAALQIISEIKARRNSHS